MTITAHCLVKNEARFLWYSVMSVIKHVDKILLWDTGSTDETLEIINVIRKTENGKRKVEFREYGEVTPDTFAHVRQEMLDSTETDWIIMVDGDEVWWEGTIRHLLSEIKEKGDTIESIVVPTINLVGDIFHYQEPQAGKYRLAGKIGHLNLRGVNRKIPGLKSFGSHGQWGWVDGENRMIQYRDSKNILFIDAPYLHATNIPRAGNFQKEEDVPKRKMKRKYELGIPFPLDFYYPEVFFRPKPRIVPSPWEKMSISFKIRAAVETPLRKIKRRFLPGKVGY
ncbi:MAG: glycosyltransferase [Candidatus Blackburnbacteria bacterium]|nr:glycosyltransferase [Candidatus Blackburnbacteria bacterium]